MILARPCGPHGGTGTLVRGKGVVGINEAEGTMILSKGALPSPDGPASEEEATSQGRRSEEGGQNRP